VDVRVSGDRIRIINNITMAKERKYTINLSRTYLLSNKIITLKIFNNENFPHNIASKHAEDSSLLVCFEVVTGKYHLFAIWLYLL
jgi:hypothetical protein